MKGLVQLQKGLEVFLAVYGQEHPLVAASKYNIAGLREAQPHSHPPLARHVPHATQAGVRGPGAGLADLSRINPPPRQRYCVVYWYSFK